MKRINYVLVLAILIIIGLGLFFVQTRFCAKSPMWYAIVGNIGCAVLIGGIISLGEHIFARQENERWIERVFNVSKTMQDSGLKQILIDSSAFHYHDLVVNSERFSAIMNDGRRWVGNHTDAIEKRFNRRGTLTEFFFVDPESDFCKALEKKTRLDDIDVNDQDTPDAKIHQTESLLKSTWNRSKREGVLKIYYLKNYPTQTLFYTEDTVVATPYQTSSGRATIPLFEYEYNPNVKVQSIAKHLQDDLKAVRKESKCVYDSEQCS